MKPYSPPRAPLALLIPIALSGCFLTPRPIAPDRSSGTIITAADVEASGAETMWDALRMNVKYAMFQENAWGTPERIRRRGASTIVLFEDMMILVDHVRVPDFVILDQMPARDIEWIHVLTGLEATTYYGTNAGDGAILIFTKTG